MLLETLLLLGDSKKVFVTFYISALEILLLTYLLTYLLKSLPGYKESTVPSAKNRSVTIWSLIGRFPVTLKGL